MADISSILNGAFSPPPLERFGTPESQLIDAMLGCGLTPPDDIVMDGNIHRFKSGVKGKGGTSDKTGWYVAYGDGVPAGRFGCWRSDIEQTWRANIDRTLSPAEEMAITRRMAEARVARDAEIAKKRDIASNDVDIIWGDCSVASAEHPYIKSKGIQVHGARVTGDGRLVLPLYNEAGSLSSLQYIDKSGGKLYHPGGQTGGCYNVVGSVDGEIKTLYVAEGFATAASIHEVTNQPCVASYSASNLVPVVEILRAKFGASLDIVVIADNDKSGVGLRYAEQACVKSGARYLLIPIEGDANDYAAAGHNLLELLAPQKSDWLIRADGFAQQPSPIEWSIKGWLQRSSLIMIHGPSGGGKTFVVLDMILTMAAGFEHWRGLRCRSTGPIVYLAGEGHHGLKSRIAGWMCKNKVNELNAYVSKDGCDLNTPEGFRRVCEAVDAIGEKPEIIVVDTLHRFLNGDENSAQDAKTMLDACSGLIARYGCSVVLVHHTGVSDEAQHRARGSSAWRGALDIEISVVPGNKDKDTPMQLVQRKSKDAELSQDMAFNLVSTQVFDWIDEDGEPVTTAVLEDAFCIDEPVKKVDSAATIAQKKLLRAWHLGGGEVRDNTPYISRSAFRYLLETDGLTDRKINTETEAGNQRGTISILINADIITPYENGWIVKNDVQASIMLLQK